MIASKFPTYFVRHPNKVAWLIHQYRAAYELCGTVYSDFGHNEPDLGLRDTLIRRPPQNLAPALDILGWADDALDWTKRALSR